MAKNKTPKRRCRPGIKKQPRRERISFDKVSVVWCFSMFDNTIWHDANYNDDRFVEIGKHLKSYQGLTWADVKRKDHLIERRKLIRDARNRLDYLKQDDTDALWRLQFTGLQRLWGIREGATFRALWWDPQHKICPSKPRNT